jgi:peptide chain release factor 1
MSNITCIAKLGSGGVFSLALLKDSPGILNFKATGDGAKAFFENEVGGHRWQRVPPNEKRGRVHTSTITVAAFSAEMQQKQAKVEIKEEDLDWKTCRGSGAGGQNRNKRETSVTVTHIPTGIVIRSETQRTQGENKRIALQLLKEKLGDVFNSSQQQALSSLRKEQVGSGMRGDKRRTIQCQNDIVVDHISNKQWDLKDYLKGKWD